MHFSVDTFRIPDESYPYKGGDGAARSIRRHMKNTAIIARKRISFIVWMDRLEELLRAGGHKSRHFPNVSWQKLYEQGSKPLEVAAAVLELVEREKSGGLN